MKKAIDLVEQKRKKVYDKLQQLLVQGEISSEFYKELVELSEQLRRNLAVAFIEGEKLVDTGAIKDIPDLFKLEKKPLSHEQMLIKMRNEIEGALSSKNVYVQAKAMIIIKELNRKYDFPEEFDAASIYECLSEKYVPQSKHDNTFLYLEHMRMAAKAIYRWVQENIAFVSDPPSDWFKPALHTLIVEGGDCDDLAILLSSLWRSVGFKTYLGFIPRHVFPGIILARLSPSAVGADRVPPEVREASASGEEAFFAVEEVVVPADPKLSFPIKLGNIERCFDAFDLAFRGKEFEEKLTALTQELVRVPERDKEVMEGEFNKEMDAMVDVFKKLLSAESLDMEAVPLRRLLRR